MSDEKTLLEEQLEQAPLEIEIDDQNTAAESQQAAEDAKAAEDGDKEFSKRVQKRIYTLVTQRKEAEAAAETARGELAGFKARLERLEENRSHEAEKDFKNRYQDVRKNLQRAIEEGNTEEQVSYQEHLADLRAAQRLAEMQRAQQTQQRTTSPTVGRAAQTAADPTPAKTINWWKQNSWFNAEGFERETAAARAIDVQMDLEGMDKESDEYYATLNNRLRRMFPELSGSDRVEAETTTRRRAQSRPPVAPTAGGPSRRGNRVKMTKEQLQMARELGITDEKGLRAYEAEILSNRRETQ